MRFESIHFLYSHEQSQSAKGCNIPGVQSGPSSYKWIVEARIGMKRKGKERKGKRIKPKWCKKYEKKLLIAILSPTAIDVIRTMLHNTSKDSTNTV